MENVRKVAQIALFIIVGGFLLSFVLYFGTFFAYLNFPEWFSSHSEFYRTCKGIPPGATIEEARTTMKRYLEPGRTWSPPPTVPAGLFGAVLPGVRESRTDHETRIVFIPDPKNISDWCVVYPKRGKVARVEVVPD